MGDRIVSVNIIGGLGNQMFQIAAAYAYAKRENGTLQIRYMDRYEKNDGRDIYWDSVFIRVRDSLVSRLPPLKAWKEFSPITYTPIPPLTDDGIYLTGYMQSSKYYADAESKQAVKDLFRVDEDQKKEINHKYQVLIDQKHRVVVIHARRTDYLLNAGVHGPLPGDYYKEAVNRAMKTIENPIFVLASDDNSFWGFIAPSIPDVFSHEHYTICENEIHTMYLLQQFENFIMSNSTFIWWIVWLADSKHVWVPSKWFGPRGPKDCEDIYEPNWERIPMD